MGGDFPQVTGGGAGAGEKGGWERVGESRKGEMGEVTTYSRWGSNGVVVKDDFGRPWGHAYLSQLGSIVGWGGFQEGGAMGVGGYRLGSRWVHWLGICAEVGVSVGAMQ